MKKIEIFDPAMCCSTGVCGPGVDPELLRMATMVSNLQKAVSYTHLDVYKRQVALSREKTLKTVFIVKYMRCV